MPSADISNKVVSNATAQVMQVLARVVRLKDGNPNHLKLAVEMGEIMTPIFATYAMLVTFIPLVLLSAAMEMVEHLDPMRQQFSSVPVWENIQADNLRIQQHPLKDKAHNVAVSGLVPAIPLDPVTGITRVRVNLAGVGWPKPKPMPTKKVAINSAVVPGAGSSRPKPKPLSKKKMPEEPCLEDDGIEIVPGHADNGPNVTDQVIDKGKGKEIAPPKDMQEVEGRGRTLTIKKRRRDSTPSQPLVTAAIWMPWFADTLPLLARISKRHKVAPVPMAPAVDLLKEDINADNNGSELVLHCDQCLKVSKLKCLHAKADTPPMPKDIPIEDDAEAWASPALSVDSVPPIATLLPACHSPEPATSSSSPILDPARQSVVPPPQQVMELDSSGDAIVDELQAMTLEVLNDNVALSSKQLGLQDVSDGVQAKLVKLQAHHTTTTDLVNALTERIAAQDTNIRELQGLRTQLTAVQNEIKVLQEESVTHDQTLRHAQEQLI
ncbi:hypothetical protein EDB19DRAFT_1833434 [Suillus lakei]|nr:hypothetical protein EDB19DRAFT_1833434 [Suillus lakei]